MPRRDEKKKQRRQHRLDKKHQQRHARADLELVINALEQYSLLGDPKSFPGTCDETLARPDLVKADLMDFAIRRFPGKPKFDRLEFDLQKGLLNNLPDIEHWAMEEFTWHGLPGDSWQPVDEYRQSPKVAYSPAARTQIGLWKLARLGLFELGKIVGDTIWLREWDVVRQQSIGEPFRAITLNMGGVHVHAADSGKLLLTYVSPWNLEQNIRCGMGYGLVLAKGEAVLLQEFLGLRRLEIVSRPLPWLVSREAEKKCLLEWRRREWHSWFAERIVFPFEAIVAISATVPPAIATVLGLLATTPAEAEHIGIYFHALVGKETALAAGGTTVTPLDFASPNRLAFAEYQRFRELVGPPVGTLGQPDYREVVRTRR